MKFIKNILLLINIALVLCLLGVYVCPYVEPTNNSFIALLGVLYPVILLANFAIMFIWMLFDYRYIFISLITIFIGWNHFTGFITLSGPTSKEKGITLMSFNTHNNYSLRNKNKDEQEKRVLNFKAYLTSISPDIICIQEAGKFAKDIFSQVFERHHMHSYNNRLTGIFSKHPIIRKGQIDFKTKTNSCLYADIKVNSDTIRVYNLHLKSNQISQKADKVLSESNTIESKKAMYDVLDILQRYRSNVITRSEQVKMVKAHADKSPYPVIIAGDMNDPPTSYMYHQISKGMTDSFREKGNGIGVTYGGSIPMLRIDYILTDPTFEVLNYQTRKEKYSDHFPILSEVQLR